MNELLNDDAARSIVTDEGSSLSPESATTTTTASNNDPTSSPLDNAIAKHCAACSKAPSDPEKTPLKDCTKCHSISYCSRDCQKADFKSHKKVCANLAQAYAQTSEAPRMQVNRPPPKSSGGKKGLQKWQFDT